MSLSIDTSEKNQQKRKLNNFQNVNHSLKKEPLPKFPENYIQEMIELSFITGDTVKQRQQKQRG